VFRENELGILTVISVNLVQLRRSTTALVSCFNVIFGHGNRLNKITLLQLVLEGVEHRNHITVDQAWNVVLHFQLYNFQFHENGTI
jgi:hypothetical protein